jgi:folate-binding protein YgfZ
MSLERPPTYGDTTGEYLAARRGAGLVEGSHDLVWVEGQDAISFLDGQLSQEIVAMEPGEVARSFLLEPRGKLRALLWVLRGADRVGLVADRGLGPVVVEQLTRFRFRVEAAIELDERPVAMLWGAGSPAVLSAAGLPAPAGWSEAEGAVVASVAVGVARFAVAGVNADRLVESGARRVGALAETSVRIEAGEPVMGIDVDDSSIPQETGLVPQSVSFTKGCYLGQELVARIDSRGHVNRMLRGIVIRDTVIPPVGAELLSGDAVVGTVSSVGESLSLRAPVALGMVRREAEPGADVQVRWPGGSARGEVRALPLDDFSGDSE